MPDFNKSKDKEFQKQAMASFFSGILQSAQNAKQREKQMQHEQSLLEKGRNDKNYDAKLKYFIEMSKDPNPQNKRIGQLGLQELGVLPKGPTNMFSDQPSALGQSQMPQEPTFEIPGMPGGAIYSKEDLLKFEMSKNRGSDRDYEREYEMDELKFELDMYKTQLSEVRMRITDLTDSTGRVRDPKEYEELKKKESFLLKKIGQIKKKDTGNDTNNPIQQLLEKNNKLMEMLTKERSK